MRPDAKCYLKRTALTLSLALTFGHYRDTGTRAERSGQCGSSFFLLFGRIDLYMQRRTEGT